MTRGEFDFTNSALLFALFLMVLPKQGGCKETAILKERACCLPRMTA
jgi:hypothetical protein